MSQHSQDDRPRQEKVNKWSSRLSSKSINNQRKLQQQASGNDYMISKMIKKSLYQQQQQMDVQKQQQNINNNNNQLQYKKQQKQQDEYESISSDRSQQQQQHNNQKYNSDKRGSQQRVIKSQGKMLQQSIPISSGSRNLYRDNNNTNDDNEQRQINKFTHNRATFNLQREGNNDIDKIKLSIKSITKQPLVSSTVSSQIRNTRQQRVSVGSQKFESSSSSLSNPAASNHEKMNTKHYQVQNSTRPKDYQQYKYPSIETTPNIIANNNKNINQKSISSSSSKSSSSSPVSIIKSNISNKKLEEQQQKRSFKYYYQQNSQKQLQQSIIQKQKNYALTMKKVTSHQSPKRSLSIQGNNKKFVTSSHQGKIKQFETVINYDDVDGKMVEASQQKEKSIYNSNTNRYQVGKGQQQQHQTKQPNMFYVSISGQQMYPSLDLKKDTVINHSNAINIINHQELQQNSQHTNQRMSSSSMRNNNEIRQQTKKSNQQKPKKKQENQLSTTSKQLDPSLPYKIKISEYRSEYFLKVQTQVFTITVDYPPSDKDIQMKQLNNKNNNNKESHLPIKQIQLTGQCFSIQRRFSDFVFLYQSIVTNHLGYIIYPFPQKSLQSFVKIKLQSLIGNSIIMNQTSFQYESQKMQLIQRRIQELQKFVNFLLQHQQLKYSQQLAIFLTNDQQLYVKSRQRITKYIEQYKELQSSGNILQQGKKNIKKVIQTGYGMVMKWWAPQSNNISSNMSSNSSKINQPIKKNTTTTTNHIPTTFKDQNQLQLAREFYSYSNAVQTMYGKFHMLQKSLNRLIEMYEKVIGFKDIDTEFDYLMKLCAKVSSGKEYTKNMKVVVGEELLRDVDVMRRWLEQVRGQLVKREQMRLLIQELKSSLGYNADLSAKISKLQRRMDRFDKNFRFGFNQLIEQCEQTFQKSRKNFSTEWQGHCKNMVKIWK